MADPGRATGNHARERVEFTGITGFLAVAVLCLGLGVGVFLLVLGLGLLVWSWA